MILVMNETMRRIVACGAGCFSTLNVRTLSACAIAGMLAVGTLGGCASTTRPQDLGEVSVSNSAAARCGEVIGGELAARLRAKAAERGGLVVRLGEFENQTRSLDRRTYAAFRGEVERTLHAAASEDPALTLVTDRATPGALVLHAESFRMGRGDSAELMTEFRLVDDSGGEVWSARLGEALAMPEPVS